MDKLNEYLQNLINSGSYELRLEPNKPPYTVSSNGYNEIQHSAILGTQISQLVFPLIPTEVRQELPNKDEVQFVHPHNLGNFNFRVKKSSAGFNVTISPVIQNEPQPELNPAPIQNELNSATIITTNSSVNQENIVQISKPTFNFENPQTPPIVETQFQSANPIVEEPQKVTDPIFPTAKIETASVNDPEFITTFSASSNYEPPGNKYDYSSNVEIISSDPPQTYEVPQFVQPQTYETPQFVQPQAYETPQFVQPQTFQTPQIQTPNEVVQQFQPVQQPQFVQNPSTLQDNHAHKHESAFAPVVANPQAKSKMDSFFYKMAEIKASDLHLSVSMPPMVRKDGKIQTLTDGEVVLEPEAMEELLTSIMPEKNQEEFARRHDTDFAYEIEGLARFRANIFMDRKGMGGVFRIIPSKILTATDLGLSKFILDLCELSKGLVVVTGPTGSGKSTTLCAMVDHINRNREDHLITIEDPIEFVHDNKKCLVNQREVHNHTDSFKDALRAALREDPDILLVGEMRDLETISIAIETAETGHLVFGTLHTTTAASTVDRIIDQFPADRQQQIRVMLSESLKGVIAQTLLPKKGGGRVAALEVLIVTPAISNLIREGKTFQIPSAMQTGKNVGMIMLNDALMDLVHKGLVEPRDAYIKAVDKIGFESMLTKNGFRI